MATRLYFHAALNDTGGLPTSEQSTKTANFNYESQSVNRSMDTTIGTGQQVQTFQTSAFRNDHYGYVTKFVSPPLDGTNISSNTWTYNFAVKISSFSVVEFYPVPSNSDRAPVNCYVWRPSNGTKVGTIFDGNASNTYYDVGFSNTTSEKSEHGTFFGSSVFGVDPGDVIILEMWVRLGTHNSSTASCQVFYDGNNVTSNSGTTVSNHASYLETPQNLNFSSADLVSQTSIHKYKISQLATKTSIQKYKIIANVLKTSIQKYNSIANATQTTIHKWHLGFEDLVLALSIHRYHLTQSAAQNAIHKYDIRNNATKTIIHKWNLLNNVLRTSIHKWNLISLLIRQDSSHKYYTMKNQGTTTGTVSANSTETVLFDEAEHKYKYYTTWVFLDRMDDGDTYTFRLYFLDEVSGTMKLYASQSFSDRQTSPALLVMALATKRYRVTVQKTAGIDRQFNWSRLKNT